MEPGYYTGCDKVIQMGIVFGSRKLSLIFCPIQIGLQTFDSRLRTYLTYSIAALNTLARIEFTL